MQNLIASDSLLVVQFILTLNEHRSKVNERLEEERKQCQTLQQELIAVSAQIEAHKVTIAKQELSASDVQRMNAERCAAASSCSLDLS